MPSAWRNENFIRARLESIRAWASRLSTDHSRRERCITNDPAELGLVLDCAEGRGAEIPGRDALASLAYVRVTIQEGNWFASACRDDQCGAREQREFSRSPIGGLPIMTCKS